MEPEKKLAEAVLDRALQDMQKFVETSPQTLQALIDLSNQCPSKAFAANDYHHPKHGEGLVQFFHSGSEALRAWCDTADVDIEYFLSAYRKYTTKMYGGQPGGSLSLVWKVEGSDALGLPDAPLFMRRLLEALEYGTTSEKIRWVKCSHLSATNEIGPYLQDYVIDDIFLKASATKFFRGYLQGKPGIYKQEQYFHGLSITPTKDAERTSLVDYHFVELSRETQKKVQGSRGPVSYRRYVLFIIDHEVKTISIYEQMGKLAKAIYYTVDRHEEKMHRSISLAEAYGQCAQLMETLFSDEKDEGGDL